MAVSSLAPNTTLSFNAPDAAQPLSFQIYAGMVVNEDLAVVSQDVTAPTMANTVLVGQPNEALVAAGPGPHLLVSGGDSLMIGGPGTNVILGAPAASANAATSSNSFPTTPFDVFDPGVGSHTLMVGGPAQDFFVFGANATGQTVISNFNPASDQVDIQTGPPAVFGPATPYTGPVTDTPGGTIIPLPSGGQVELQGIHPASLMPGDLLAFG